MSVWEIVSMSFCGVGALFYLAGSIGMLRLPDVLSRLHAAVKADNLGLAFVLAGMSIQSGSVAVGLKLGLIWLLLLVSSATSSNLIAQKALQESRAWSVSK